MNLDLDLIRTDGGTQSRVALSEETYLDYAEAMMAGAKFPPVIVFHDGATYWLADGFHRFFAVQEAGLHEIDADVRQGTRRDAVLYSWGANDKHGQPRSNADKRNIVTAILKDEEAGEWSDNKIAKDFGFAQSFVSRVRKSLNSEISEKAAERTYTTKHGTQAVMQTSKIGQAEKRRPTTPPPEAPKPAPEPAKVEPEADEPPEYTELDAAHDLITGLQADLVVARMGDISEDQKTQAAERIAALQAEVNTLTATLKAVQFSRDSLMEERAQMVRQMAAQRAEIARLKASK